MIQSLFQFPPKKLPVYDFKKTESLDINKNENQIIKKDEINDDEEEEKNEKEKLVKDLVILHQIVKEIQLMKWKEI